MGVWSILGTRRGFFQRSAGQDGSEGGIAFFTRRAAYGIPPRELAGTGGDTIY